MRTYFKRQYRLCGLLVLVGIIGGLSVPAAAAGSNLSGTVTQSYNAAASVLPGMVVETAPKDPTTVIPLTNADTHNMLGAVIPANDATIVLTPQTVSTQQVLVSATGRYNLLVSTENGPIKSGDYVSVSAVPGIVMEAGDSQSEAIGRAAGSFDGAGSLGTMSLKGAKGHSSTVAIGSIPVNVQLSANPLFQKNLNGLSGFVTKTANTLSGQPVSPNRAYLSAAVMLATLGIAGIMFYTGTRSGIIAIGRNPLSQNAVTRGLVKTMAAGLLVFAGGALTAYLILHA